MVEQGLLGRVSSRYFIFNGGAYRRHGTLELRVWPQLDFEDGMELIKFTAKGIEEVISESRIIDDIPDAIIGEDRVLTEEDSKVPTMAEMRKKRKERYTGGPPMMSSSARTLRDIRHSRGDRCADPNCGLCAGLVDPPPGNLAYANSMSQLVTE